MWKLLNRRFCIRLIVLLSGREARYFATAHISLPMIDHVSFKAKASSIEPSKPEFTFLRLTVQMHGACTAGEHSSLHENLYQHARKGLESLESDGSITGLEVVQAWVLIAVYEFKQRLLARAWMSSGKASRLTQMLGLHQLDMPKYALIPTTDEMPPISWAEMEEKRRIFWCVFVIDRYAALGSGLPISILESDVSHSKTLTIQSFIAHEGKYLIFMRKTRSWRFYFLHPMSITPLKIHPLEKN